MFVVVSCCFNGDDCLALADDRLLCCVALCCVQRRDVYSSKSSEVFVFFFYLYKIALLLFKMHCRLAVVFLLRLVCSALRAHCFASRGPSDCCTAHASLWASRRDDADGWQTVLVD